MKRFLILFLLVSIVGFAQVTIETVTFSDTTTSDTLTPPNRMYLSGIAKPDSGGDIITFTAVFGDTAFDVLTMQADSAYTITLPDSTNTYFVPTPQNVFAQIQSFMINFAKATSVTLTLVWSPIL